MRLFLKYLGNLIAPKNNTADRSEVIRKRLAMVYAIIGWNSVMYLFYLTGRENLSLGGSDAGEKVLNAAKKISTHDIEYVQVRGLNVQSTPVDRSMTVLPKIVEKQ